jgi:hypothetical protein
MNYELEITSRIDYGLFSSTPQQFPEVEEVTSASPVYRTRFNPMIFQI